MGKKLFVGNLSYEVTQDVLQKIFSEAGTVVFSRVISDRATGRSKGFGFVEMSSEKEAAEAIRLLEGRDCMGRGIRVSEARDFEPRSESRGPRSDRGFSDRGYSDRGHGDRGHGGNKSFGSRH